jgi:hypothetical protein
MTSEQIALAAGITIGALASNVCWIIFSSVFRDIRTVLNRIYERIG